MTTIISEIENKYLDYIRTSGKEPTHLVLGTHEYKQLLTNLHYKSEHGQDVYVYNTYRGMKILICESDKVLKPSVGILI